MIYKSEIKLFNKLSTIEITQIKTQASPSMNKHIASASF